MRWILLLAFLGGLSQCKSRRNFTGGEKVPSVPGASEEQAPSPEFVRRIDAWRTQVAGEMLVTRGLRAESQLHANTRALVLHLVPSPYADHLELRLCRTGAQQDCGRPAGDDDEALSHQWSTFAQSTHTIFNPPEGRIAVGVRSCVESLHALDPKNRCGPWLEISYQQPFNPGGTERQVMGRRDTYSALLQSQCTALRESMINYLRSAASDNDPLGILIENQSYGFSQAMCGEILRDERFWDQAPPIGEHVTALLGKADPELTEPVALLLLGSAGFASRLAQDLFPWRRLMAPPGGVASGHVKRYADQRSRLEAAEGSPPAMEALTDAINAGNQGFHDQSWLYAHIAAAIEGGKKEELIETLRQALEVQILLDGGAQPGVTHIRQQLERDQLFFHLAIANLHLSDFAGRAEIIPHYQKAIALAREAAAATDNDRRDRLISAARTYKVALRYFNTPYREDFLRAGEAYAQALAPDVSAAAQVNYLAQGDFFAQAAALIRSRGGVDDAAYRALRAAAEGFFPVIGLGYEDLYRRFALEKARASQDFAKVAAPTAEPIPPMLLEHRDQLRETYGEILALAFQVNLEADRTPRKSDTWATEVAIRLYRKAKAYGESLTGTASWLERGAAAWQLEMLGELHSILISPAAVAGHAALATAVAGTDVTELADAALIAIYLGTLVAENPFDYARRYAAQDRMELAYCNFLADQHGASGQEGAQSSFARCGQSLIDHKPREAESAYLTGKAQAAGKEAAALLFRSADSSWRQGKSALAVLQQQTGEAHLAGRPIAAEAFERATQAHLGKNAVSAEFYRRAGEIGLNYSTTDQAVQGAMNAYGEAARTGIADHAKVGDVFLLAAQILPEVPRGSSDFPLTMKPLQDAYGALIQAAGALQRGQGERHKQLKAAGMLFAEAARANYELERPGSPLGALDEESRALHEQAAATFSQGAQQALEGKTEEAQRAERAGQIFRYAAAARAVLKEIPSWYGNEHQRIVVAADQLAIFAEQALTGEHVEERVRFAHEEAQGVGERLASGQFTKPTDILPDPYPEAAAEDIAREAWAHADEVEVVLRAFGLVGDDPVPEETRKARQTLRAELSEHARAIEQLRATFAAL